MIELNFISEEALRTCETFERSNIREAIHNPLA